MQDLVNGNCSCKYVKDGTLDILNFFSISSQRKIEYRIELQNVFPSSFAPQTIVHSSKGWMLEALVYLTLNIPFCLEYFLRLFVTHSRLRGSVNCWAPSMKIGQVAKFIFKVQ